MASRMRLVSGLALAIGLTAFVVYEDDDRRNYFKGTKHEQNVADATLVMVTEGYYRAADEGAVDLLPFAAGYCEGEAFAIEPNPGSCTAFRVGERVLATAGHCVTSVVEAVENAESDVLWIRNFRINEEEAVRPDLFVEEDRIYRTVRHSYINGGGGADYGLVELDRALPDDMPILEFASERNAENSPDAEYTVIGYPDGLPVKIASGAFYLGEDEDNDDFFVLSSDTFGGNSGSPVLRSDNIDQGRYIVEGILVRGQDDFTYRDTPPVTQYGTLLEAKVDIDGSVAPTSCRRARQCPEWGCSERGNGEDIQYAAPLRRFLEVFEGPSPKPRSR